MADDARTAFVRAMVNEGTNDADITAALKVYDAQHQTPMSTALDVGKGILKGVGSSAASIGDLMVKAGMIPGETPALPSPTIQAAQQATTATNTPQMVGKGLEMAAEMAPGAISVARAAPALVRGALSSPLAASAAEALTSDRSLVTQIRSAAARKLLGGMIDWAKTPAAQREADTTIPDAVEALKATGSTEAAAPSAPAAAAPRPYFLKPEAQMAPQAGPSATPQALPQAWQQFAKPASFPPTDIEGSGLAAAFDQELAKRGAKASDVIPQVLRNKALPADIRTQVVTALEKVARKQAGALAPQMTDPTLPASWQALVQK